MIVGTLENSFLKPRNSLGAVAQGPLLTAQDCQLVIELAKGFPVEDGVVGEARATSDVRKSRLRWIPCTPQTEKLFSIIHKAVQHANDKYWQLDLLGFTEPLQFTEYHAGGDHYDWHLDLGDGRHSVRKLSLVIQLSSPQDYEGGLLEIRGQSFETASRDLGNVTIFPSYLPHRVTPVTSGMRHSLVAWISGPPFR